MNTPVWGPNSPRTSALAGQVIAENFAGWSPEIRQEFADNAHNHQVGSVLLSETDEVKVWSIRLAPGERVPAHRHVLNYFWTALTDGISLQHIDDLDPAGGTFVSAVQRGFPRVPHYQSARLPVGAWSVGQ